MSQLRTRLSHRVPLPIAGTAHLSIRTTGRRSPPTRYRGLCVLAGDALAVPPESTQPPRRVLISARSASEPGERVLQAVHVAVVGSDEPSGVAAASVRRTRRLTRRGARPPTARRGSLPLQSSGRLPLDERRQPHPPPLGTSRLKGIRSRGSSSRSCASGAPCAATTQSATPWRTAAQWRSTMHGLDGVELKYEQQTAVWRYVETKVNAENHGKANTSTATKTSAWRFGRSAARPSRRPCSGASGPP